MNQKCLVFLLGFEVTLADRRNDEEKEENFIVPFLGECPEELQAAYEKIKRYYNRLGFSIMHIEYVDTKVKELDLNAEYNLAPTTEQYYEE